MSVPAATIDRVARSASGSPFVARSEQLEQFRSALERARSAEPGAILLSIMLGGVVPYLRVVRLTPALAMRAA